MKLARRKRTFRVTGFGQKITVEARNAAGAVCQFRRLAQPEGCRFLSGAPAKTKQVQPRSLEDGSWQGLEIEVLSPSPGPVAQQPEPPMAITPACVPSASKVSKPKPPLGAGQHPGTALPTPRWEWVFHSAGAKGGRYPIDYARVKKPKAA